MKKFLSLVLALVMTMSLVTISAGAKDFTDADKVNYAEAVDVISAVKVVDGYTDGSFNPQATLTRGAAAKIICNLILGPTTAGALVADAAPYKDVPANSTFAGYIAYCQKEGIIDGYTDGTFRPGNTLTGYAFMKLLLGALGYDKDVEGYNGANWSINVAKRALNLGLDDGLVDDFNGVKPVTREEAALYAFNALNADMVEYDAKTTVSVGGADVVIAGSAAKVVANKAVKETIDNDNDMQFAEKYFPKLVKNASTSDVFGRPATKWTYNNDKVGTYTDTPDVVYTKSVDLGDIYADLDLDHQIDATLILNGNTAMAKEPVQRGVTDSLSNSGNGVLSEVYYDHDADTIKIIQVSTYIGQITAVKEATKAYDAYVTVGETLKNYGVLTSSTDDFETDEAFEVEDYVLFTYADGAIQSVEKAESVEGTMNTIYKTSKIDINGTTYSFSKQKTFTDATSDFNVKSSYVVYLDKYGYAIHLEESEFVSGDYAFVEDARYATGTWGYKQAKLVYLDGTTSKVDTDKNYAASGDLDYATNNYLVTFKTNSSDETIMKKVDGTKYYSTFTDAATAYTFHMKNGDAAIFIDDTDGDNVYDTGDGDLRVFANSKTMFVVKNTTTGKYKAYTGVKAMPSINTGLTKYPVSISYYCKNGDILTYAFIQAPGAAITSGTDNVTFLSGVSLSKHTTDTDLQDYYTYNAVVAGEITTVRVAANKVTDEANKIYTDASMDTDGIVIDYTPASGTYAKFGTGVKKLSGEHTLGFNLGGGNYEYYTVADDCQVFMVDEDGEITKSTTTAVVSDAAQAYSVYLNSSWEVKYLFLDEVATSVSGTPIGTEGYAIDKSNGSYSLQIQDGSGTGDGKAKLTWSYVGITKDGAPLVNATGLTLTLDMYQLSQNGVYNKVGTADVTVKTNSAGYMQSSSGTGIVDHINVAVPNGSYKATLTLKGTGFTLDLGSQIVTLN